MIRTGGKQFRITENIRIRVPKIEAHVGDEVVFDEVLMISQEGETHVGKPTIRGASVKAEVIGHGLEDKIVVFKYKRRKNERRKAGHRQGYTEVLIKEIQLHTREKETPDEPPEEATEEDTTTT